MEFCQNLSKFPIIELNLAHSKFAILRLDLQMILIVRFFVNKATGSQMLDIIL